MDRTMMKTRYEEKKERNRPGRYAKGDFIIADAKDADLDRYVTQKTMDGLFLMIA